MAVFSAYRFDGGMNDVINPQLLEPNSGTLFYNCELEDGKIRGIKDIVYNGSRSPEQLGHYGNRNRSLVKWFERTYWSDNVTNSAPFFGGNEESLGIPYPDAPPSLEAVGDAGLTGSYRYAVTFVNANGWESCPGSYDGYYSEISVEGKKINVSCPAFPQGISYAKIYRTVDHGAEFYYVGKLEHSGDVHLDDMSDVDAQLGEVLSTFDHFPPPDRGRYICEAQGTFFLAVDSRLYYSVNGNPHAWPPLQFIGVDDTITGISREQQGILVFTRNNAYQIVGFNSPDTITKNSIPGNQGCVSFRSLSSVNNNPIWLSNDGICLWDGNVISIISKERIRITDLSVRYSVSANDAYYLMFKDSIIVFNLRLGGVFYKLKFTYDMEYAWYDADNDILYFTINNAAYRFNSGSPREFEYHSPMIGKTYLVKKKFRDIFINCTREASLKVNIDGKDVFEIVVPPGMNKVKFPMHMVGYDCFVNIKSKGVLNEYSVTFE